ncbi:MAG: LysM peptidoglycan-binding domain-containing protein [Opitutales bacterium]
MKILQIFGAVVAIHLLAFIFIFASPGCQSSPRNIPTPDATMPTASAPAPESAVSYNSGPAQPADLGTTGGSSYTPPLTPGRANPTRPGSPNAAALAPAKPTADDVAPDSTYTVQKGDSLWSIAKKNHLTVGELARANNLAAGTALQPGKKLIVPGKGPAPVKDLSTAPAAIAAAPAETKTAAAAPAHANGETVKHTVQPGEKLGTIAKKYQVGVGELAAANNITDPAKIRVGQQLIIPGYKAVGTKSGGTKTTAKNPPADKAAVAAAPAKDETPHFDIKAPPQGQDLDSGLKDNTTTNVPTIKVDEVPPPDETPKK